MTVGERSGIAIVGKDGPGPDEDAILDRDTCADVDMRVDLHIVPDRHPVGDVGLLPDDAVVADRRRTTQVHAVPDRRAGTDRHTALHDRGRVDAGLVHTRSSHALASRAGRGARIRAMSTATQPPELRDLYAASTAATVRRHSPGLIHGAPVPATRALNDSSISRCDSALS